VSFVFPWETSRLRILFTSTPLDGHFRPLLPLAGALSARGHDVAFATHESWHEHIAAAGYPAFAAGTSHAEARLQLEPHREEIAALPPLERRPHIYPRLFGRGHAPPKLPGLLRAGREWRPHVLVWESSDLAAPVAAAALGVPAVNHSFGAMVPLAALRRAEEAVLPLWREVGLEPPPYAGAFAGLYVDTCPPSLAWEEPCGEAVLLGPGSTPAASPPPWLEELARPLVYVTLGTVFNDPAVLERLLAGLDEVPGALVTTGRDVDPSALGSVPPHVRVERFVPQDDVLSACAAAVVHGGSGSTLAALSHGLPLVLVPQGADQFENAARVEAAGAGVVVQPEELSGETVRAALRRVLGEPSYAEAARRVAAEIAAMPGAAEVAALVEERVSL
jgi:UDP:flavonoid glycosyltransferase YjiC (YdhE family)